MKVGKGKQFKQQIDNRPPVSSDYTGYISLNFHVDLLFCNWNFEYTGIPKKKILGWKYTIDVSPINRGKVFTMYKCLFIIASNRWVYWIAYKRLEMPVFLALICVYEQPRESLKLTIITKCELQIWKYQQFLLQKSVDLSNSSNAWAFPGASWIDGNWQSFSKPGVLLECFLEC